MPNRQRGLGFWKLNISILEDEMYKQGIRELIYKAKSDYENILSKHNLWDFSKVQIKGVSIKYCIYSIQFST